MRAKASPRKPVSLFSVSPPLLPSSPRPRSLPKGKKQRHGGRNSTENTDLRHLAEPWGVAAQVICEAPMAQDCEVTANSFSHSGNVNVFSIRHMLRLMAGRVRAYQPETRQQYMVPTWDS